MSQQQAVESVRLVGIRAAPRSSVRSRASLALDNLRAVVILIVLAFHSSLAYLQWNPTKPAPFDSSPYAWRAFPIVDTHHFFGFDLFCAWQDVYLMSFMFFLSGLFVWPSLTRKSDWAFLRDRWLRLGLPYVFGTAVLMPVAVYPAYAVMAVDPSVPAYWHALLSLPFWPNGPLWFLWQLFALNIIAAIVHRSVPNAIKSLGRWSTAAGARPATYYIVLVAVSAIAYVPLALAFTPWTWSDSGIFTIQLSRPLLYVVYFFAGVGIGVEGVDRGLLAIDGALARRWAHWLAGALISLFLWMGSTALTMNGPVSIAVEIIADLCFVLACAAGCLSFVAMSLRFGTKPSPILGSLAAHAYGLYLVHYVFVVWLQFALLATPLLAVIKAPIVFGGTLLLSWITTAALYRVPLGARLIGSVRRPTAGFAP
jgi:glucans biosynthesis protein C